MLTITVNNAPVLDVLAQLSARLGDLRPAMEGIGAAMESRVSARFETETDPSGTPWAPWADSTRRSYPFAGSKAAARDDGAGNGRILDRYGTMLRSLNYRTDASSVTIGFASEVATYHEFGTQRMPRRGLLSADPDSGVLAPADERVVLDILSDFLGRL